MVETPTGGTAIPQFSTRYELKSKLGAGGMGVVYRGFDNVLKKEVAVKLLQPGLNKDAIVRFQKEARAAAKLDHPNIVKVLDFGVAENGILYLIMDYIDGRGLDYYLKKTGPMQLDQALLVFDQICQGLQHAHDHEVLHRDVKPSNVMLTLDQNEMFVVKVVDFGLAKLESDDQKLTSTGVRIGTPVYMSPEQARGDEVDHRSDIYSMGCLMFTALTGHPPLRGDSYLETITMQIESEAPRLNDGFEQPKFPSALEDAIARALNKDLGERFQTMEELRQSLLLAGDVKADAPASEPIVPGKTVWWKDFKIISAGAIAAVSIGFAYFQIVGSFDPYPLPAARQKKDEFVYDHTPEEGTWLVVSGAVHDGTIKKIAGRKKNRDVHIMDADVDDSDLDYLLEIPLRSLDLTGTKVTDRGIEKLSTVKSLQSLILNDCTAITDRCIDSILKLTRLRILSLKGTNLSDEGVKRLKFLKSLTILDLADVKGVTGRSLEALSTLPSLEAIRTEGSGVTRKDLAIIEHWSGLKAIAVGDLGLTDSDMDIFVKSKLRHLSIKGNSKVTFKGVQKVLPLELVNIDLRGCSISREEANMLENAKLLDVGSIISDHEDPSLSTQNLPVGSNGDLIRRWYHPTGLILINPPLEPFRIMMRPPEKQHRRVQEIMSEEQ